MRRVLNFIAILPILVLAACGGSSDHNDADVAFAQGMIPHHQQAVEMADLISGSSASPEVTQLGAQIKAAQDPEIVQMKGWLKDWDESTDTGHGGMDMGDGAMGEGMMTDADMRSLGKATGSAFDTQWLSMMIKHHKGAITMAQTELKEGKFDESKTLARAIIAAQEKEIATMKGILE